MAGRVLSQQILLQLHSRSRSALQRVRLRRLTFGSPESGRTAAGVKNEKLPVQIKGEAGPRAHATLGHNEFHSFPTFGTIDCLPEQVNDVNATCRADTARNICGINPPCAHGNNCLVACI